MRARSKVIVTSMLLTLTACGDETAPEATPRSLGETSGSAGATDTAPATDEVAGEPAVDAYAEWLSALARDDAETACALQAPEFTIELRSEAILEDRAELGDPCTDFVALLWEDPAFESRIADIGVTQVTEEDALLAVHLGPGGSTEQTVRMVYHRTRWRVFSIAERTGETEALPADVTRWLDAWCDLDATMSRDQVVALMGEPSGEYTVADGGEPQLWWAQDQYDFRVYLDPAGTDDAVLELVGDYDALSAADQALLPCPELRR